MISIATPLLRLHSRVRERIYRTLLADPERAWTVRELTTALPGVTVDGVRSTLYLLHGERLMESVPYQRAATFRLVPGADRALARTLSRWHQPPSHHRKTAVSGKTRES
ncbi:hypothetical protein [Catellatospora tritici]|uniref:hypothetical protein n=1 Tax=Catellatospora tritici TaxID=2851566 RepID=UPI001C2D6451|nr:hypothetical protein [Catellatospora tritici]MBV1855989.1 hypothetical protein [Catellatospora tritici]